MSQAKDKAHGLSYSQIAKELSKPTELAGYLATLPLEEGAHVSLEDLKGKVKQILLQHGVLASNGALNPDKSLESGLLERELSDPVFLPQLRTFENKIQGRLRVMNEQHNPIHLLGDSEIDTVVKNARYHPDFSVKQIPQELAVLAPSLGKMEKHLDEQAQGLLGKKVSIHFYSASDGSDAHDAQGAKNIAFNIKGSSFARFIKMLEKKQFDKEAYLEIMTTLTHEMVHSEEHHGAPTHDKVFLAKQQALLERLYQLNQRPEWDAGLEKFFRE